MNFSVRETADGAFEIIQTQPIVVGSFSDREIAKKVMAFLVEEALDEASEALEPTAPAQEPSSAQVASSVSPAAPPYVVVNTGADWTPDELKQAFMEIATGRPLKDTADAYGKDWQSLRGKWAAHKKNLVDDAQVQASETDDMEECRICGKPFRPTPERLELCKRCDG